MRQDLERDWARFADKALESSYALWNALLTINGILISVSSLLPLIAKSVSRPLVYSLLSCSSVSLILILWNYRVTRLLYLQLGKMTVEEIQLKTEKEKQQERRDAVQKHKWLQHRESAATALLLIEAGLVFLILMGAQS